MRVLIAGDYCPHGRVADCFSKKDFASVLDDIRPLTARADYSILNLECPVTKGKAIPIAKVGPNLHCSEEGVEAIKWAGFDGVTLANNHFYDYGESGVKDTLEVCRRLHLDVSGGGLSLSEASEILYKDIDGKKLAIISCCEHEFSIASERAGGSNPLNPVQQYYDIQKAKENSDYIIVIVHGGHESFQLPSPRMQETYRFFIDVGADAVVNHHQHCYSGYERYKNKLIFYGIGNFCFDWNPIETDSLWNYGYMVDLLFMDDSIRFEIIPYKQCSENPKVELLASDAFDIKLSELNKTIRDKKLLKEKVDTYYSMQSQNLLLGLQPVQNKYFTAAVHWHMFPSLISKKWLLKLQNYVFCEAHRDMLDLFLNCKN